ncbi:MAG: OsmC family protein [Planctomycetota bacterium]
MADDNAVRVRIGRDHFRTEIHAGPHEMAADEPESLGGTDTGPDPYQLLLASLGACKAITVRMYADRKGWPLEQLEVTLSHSRVHAKDCEDCSSESGMVSIIECTLDATGALDEEQRARLAEIADKCPVHKTLTGEVKIRTELA